MKVLVISAAFPPLKVGEAEHAFHLCRRLADRGLDVHVLTTQRRLTIRDGSLNVHSIMPHWLWSDLPRLARFIKRCAPEAILLIYTDRDYDYHPMITVAPTVAKTLLPRASFVTQFETEYLTRHASIFTKGALKIGARCAGPEYFDYAFGTLLCKSDRVIVLSERHQTIVSLAFPPMKSRSLVIPPPPLLRMTSDNNGVSRRHGREALGVTQDSFLIAYYGYIYPDKGIETLLKAFKIVNSQQSNSRLVMLGGGLSFLHSPSYLTAIHDLANQLGIEDKIIWTGECPSDSEEASLYLRACDVCVLPFDNGVTLNRSSLAAAAAHGLPIVTTAGEKVETPFKDEENVLLCPPRDARSLALTISSLINNPQSCRTLREGALRLAQDFFSWDIAVTRTLEALKT
jgi:glycosyltransferase involved in cell wall biosynthesis